MAVEYDTDLLQAIDDLGMTPWSGTAYRQTAPQREPLSGNGASLFGGRWNPRGVSTIYLAFPVAACVAEFVRMAEGQAKGVESFQPRDLHEVIVKDLGVLDLRSRKAREAVRIEISDIENDDRSACQEIGRHAQYLGVHAILAPSATRVGSALAAYERNVQRGQLTVRNTRPLASVL